MGVRRSPGAAIAPVAPTSSKLQGLSASLQLVGPLTLLPRSAWVMPPVQRNSCRGMRTTTCCADDVLHV